MKSRNLIGLDRQQLIERAISLGEEPFRGKQLFHQIYARKELHFSTMTDLAKSFRSKLQQHYSLVLPEIRRTLRSSDGTIKFLLRLEDGEHIESVYIPEEKRDTLCISSQVGCDVGCTFCLTARMGFRRNLTSGEIVGQILRVIRTGSLNDKGFNVVFMGMGEPLYNYRNVMKAFRLMTAPDGIDLSYRKITVSTSGVVPVLKRMAEEPILPNLAISLNAADSETRSRVMPINLKWDMNDLLDVCRNFPLESRRRITLEYVLLRDENDSEDDAVRLLKLLRGLRVKVNLIPYNPGSTLAHRRPSESRVERFRAILLQGQVTAMVRKTRGLDISAACGQLAHLTAQSEVSAAHA